MAVHLLTMLNVMGGLLREHGHKTPVSWILVGIAALVGIGVRVYRSRR
jgi:hypothetical protein